MVSSNVSKAPDFSTKGYHGINISKFSKRKLTNFNDYYFACPIKFSTFGSELKTAFWRTR